MKKVLIVTYVFPPVGGAGVQRTLKWTQYLPEFGWTPIVLTAQNPSVPVFDRDLEREIPTDLRVVRTRTWELPYGLKRGAWNRAEKGVGRKSLLSPILRLAKTGVQRLLTPDPQIGWIPSAFRAGLELIQREKVDAILVSAPPFSTFLLGAKLARKAGVPWVADFRDEWVEFYTRAYDFHRRPEAAVRIQHMEAAVVETSSAFLTVTNTILANYRKKYPKLNEGNSFWVPNGYDEKDFPVSGVVSESSKSFTLTYCGTVFEVTSARPFLQALIRALDRHPDWRDVLRVRFVGRVDPRELEPFEDPRLLGVLERKDYVPHGEAVQEMCGANALLLLLSDLPGAERILTGKIFEYLAARKSILAVVPDGEAAEVVRSTKAGLVASPSAPDQIASSLEFLISEWRKGNPLGGDPNVIQQFSRRSTTQRLAGVLDRVRTLPKDTHS